MKNILFISALLWYSISYSQGGLYFSGGIGVAMGNGNLEGIQGSYESYKTITIQNYPNDPFIDNGNWENRQFKPTLLLNAGLRGDGILLNFGYQRTSFNQEKSLIRESGYGRKFTWQEVRNEVLIEVGFGTGRFYAFAGLGTNICNFKMASYQVYPDGTESINAEFQYNGLFRGQDVGLSYSLGAKYYLMDYVNIEFKYILSTDKMPGEPEEGLTLTDNSLARVPGATEYPGDYTKPFSFDNKVLVGVRRSYFQISINFELNFD